MSAQANNTFEEIKTSVRRMTGSSSTKSLPEEVLERYINTFYSVDFLANIKIDISRHVYTFFTKPNVDRYPLDVHRYQGIRGSAYIEGWNASIYKDRGRFFNIYPRWPAEGVEATGDGSTTSFSFTISGAPLLPTMVVMGSKDSSGNPVRIVDDGGQGTTTGNLILIETDSQGNIDPALPATSPIPSGTPENTVGSINYVNGSVSLDLDTALGDGEELTVRRSPYTAQRPYSILFFRNEFIVRPVPDGVYKIEVEAYERPEQFLNNSDAPELREWSEYIAIGSAIKILRDRGDREGVQNLVPFFQEQEANILNRQGTAEIGFRTGSFYSEPESGGGYDYPYGRY